MIQEIRHRMLAGRAPSTRSIKFKLIRMQMTLVTTVLLGCSIVFLAQDVLTFRNSIMRGLDSTASILGRNLEAPLSFLDRAEAAKLLDSLQADPSIVSARVLDASGKAFASYGDLGRDEASAGWRHILHRHELKSGSERLGELVLTVDAMSFVSDLQGHAALFMTILAAGLLVAFGFAAWAQRSLSGPVKCMAGRAKEVSASGDYSIRMKADASEIDSVELLELAVEFNRMLDQIQARDLDIHKANEALEKKVLQRTAALEDAQKSALENAHAAGMAEIATGILHNIGNIVNSVNTSVEEINQLVKSSKVAGLAKANQILLENRGRLPEFFSSDPRAEALADYYLSAVGLVGTEHEGLLKEAGDMTKKMALIKDVIRTQQDYAKKGLFMEEVSLAELAEEIFSMQKTAFNRHEIQLIKKYSDAPAIKAQKVKFAHILLNLIKNAKEAMSECPPDRRFLLVDIGHDREKGVYLRLKDQGSGISRENLDRIFNHGFTTKSTGHGFGLHFCANAMTEMGGRLTAESEGPGKGAAFTMYFPVGASAAPGDGKKETADAA